MQRDQRVVRHSILGAFWGWLSTLTIYMVFASVQWGANVYSSETHWPSFHEWLLINTILVSVFSYFATFAGWLCLGFPIAAVITDRQARSFKFMISVHTIATESIFVVPCFIVVVV